MKPDKEWRVACRIPKNPTTEHRIEWYIKKAKHCRFRGVSPGIKADMKKRNIKLK